MAQKISTTQWCARDILKEARIHVRVTVVDPWFAKALTVATVCMVSPAGVTDVLMPGSLVSMPGLRISTSGSMKRSAATKKQ